MSVKLFISGYHHDTYVCALGLSLYVYRKFPE